MKKYIFNPALFAKVCLVIVLLDLGYSFYQHYHMSLGGDLGDNITPTTERGFYQVLQDPLGISVLFKKNAYPNPNRFFAHWTVYKYFRTVPILLQKIAGPITSVYLSSAIAKILIQIFILYLLSVYISNNRNPRRPEFLFAAALIFPLFQTWGYNRYMGIIDQSVVYSFFYALPVGMLGLFYLPIYRRIYGGQGGRFSPVLLVMLTLFIPVLTLNGPLIPGIALIASPLILLKLCLNNWSKLESGAAGTRIRLSVRKIPGQVLFLLITIMIFSLYSLYIGSKNSVTINESIPLIDRYSKLPKGLYYLITSKLGFPFLFLIITFNLFLLLRYYESAESRKIITFLKWSGIFALLYILVLPLGGYRSYRANILRYDTFIPVTLGIMYAFGTSSFFLIKILKGRKKVLYISAIAMILLLITNADRVNKTDYLCERMALEQIAASQDSIVAVNADCKIMDWVITKDPLIRELDAELLLLWNITDEKRLFYQNWK